MDGTFGGRLKAIRLERGLSQEDFADLLGTSKQVVSRYETNQRSPKVSIVNQYSQRLGVPLSYLLDGVGKNPLLVFDSGLTPEALEVAYAYDVASERERAMVRLTLSIDHHQDVVVAAAYKGGQKINKLTQAQAEAADAALREIDEMK